MQIELVLKNGSGESILLPEEFALDDNEMVRSLPGFAVPGKDGEEKHTTLTRTERITLKLSAIMKCDNKDLADELGAEYRSLLAQEEPYWLKRHSGSDRFMSVNATRTNYSYHRGRFEGSLFSLSAVLVSDDPYWYSTAVTTVTRTGAGSFQLANVGKAKTFPFIVIRGPASNVEITKGDQKIILQGEVLANETVVIDPKHSKVLNMQSAVTELPHDSRKLKGKNIVNRINEEFLVEGFALKPGNNPVQITGSITDVTFYYRGRWK